MQSSTNDLSLWFILFFLNLMAVKRWLGNEQLYRLPLSTVGITALPTQSDFYRVNF